MIETVILSHQAKQPLEIKFSIKNKEVDTFVRHLTLGYVEPPLNLSLTTGERVNLIRKILD